MISGMITLQEFCTLLDEEMKLSEFSDYCPNGLQVEGKREITSAAFAVSASVDAIEQAISKNADALVVHHGIFWQKDSLVVRGIKRKKLDLLLKNNVSLLAYHLPLDAHPLFGNNWKAATDLGWKELEPFSIGVRGTFEPVALEKFSKQLETYYGHKATIASGGGHTIRSAALVSGGAYKWFEEAATAGVDAFITGSFDEPAWDLAKELGVHFFALGHTATEKVGPKALMEWVRSKTKINTFFIDTDNPF
jgi:dinuclear metal center YbgI/SA1388 family protein